MQEVYEKLFSYDRKRNEDVSENERRKFTPRQFKDIFTNGTLVLYERRDQPSYFNLTRVPYQVLLKESEEKTEDHLQESRILSQ